MKKLPAAICLAWEEGVDEPYLVNGRTTAEVLNVIRPATGETVTVGLYKLVQEIKATATFTTKISKPKP